jgi:hypothetical protein
MNAVFERYAFQFKPALNDLIVRCVGLRHIPLVGVMDSTQCRQSQSDGIESQPSETGT